MSGWNSVEELLDFAIANEVEAERFYSGLARQADRPALRELLESFAREEQGHKLKLEAVKAGRARLEPAAVVADLRLADYLVEPVANPHELDYARALILAMKAEKAAFKLYTDLAAKVASAELRELFAGLAQEEAKHKLRFELEYDEHVLREN